MTPLDPKRIAEVDRSGMLGHVLSLWEQIPEAVPDERFTALAGLAPRQIVVGGLGGSAIGGDLLRGVIGGELPYSTPVTVVREYHLPRLERSGTLAILCSYSGETEETLSLYDDAAEQRLHRAVVASGGALAVRASRDGVPLVLVPKGLPPRAAVGHLLGAMTAIVSTASGRSELAGSFAETRSVLRSIAERCAPGSAANPAVETAEALRGRILGVIAPGDPLGGVALRWKTQWNENAKAFAYDVTVPEMSHNEIVAWERLREEPLPLAFAILRDAGEGAREALRLDAAREMLDEAGVPVREIRSEGSSRLARILSLVLMGDLASVYLAVMRNVDPTPIAPIERLKNRLRGGVVA